MAAHDAPALATALADLLRITGRVGTGRRWLDRALEAATVDDPLRAVALYENGLLAFWQGADEESCSLHGQSLELARRRGDRTTVALALCGLARVALREDLDWARTLCEEACGRSRTPTTPSDARTRCMSSLSRPRWEATFGGHATS